MHASPVADNIGENETLYRIKLRFFWPRLHSDVSNWIEQYPHYTLIHH